MIFEQPNLVDDYCLHYIGYQKRLEQGETEKPFEDADCSSCSLEKMSAVCCPHFINKRHLIEFRRLELI